MYEQEASYCTCCLYSSLHICTDSPDDSPSSAREGVVYPLLHVCYFTYCLSSLCFCLFVSNEHLQIFTHTYTHTQLQKHTHTHIHRQRLIPLAARVGDWHALCLIHASWYLVRVLDERTWNESYLIWETHLVPSFLFLSSNHPPRSPHPSPSSSCPDKPTDLAVQRPALCLQSSPLSCECVKT